eukprot:43515-Eustigmatos_ZCMA.PRE.1
MVPSLYTGQVYPSVSEYLLISVKPFDWPDTRVDMGVHARALWAPEAVLETALAVEIRIYGSTI